MTRRSNDIDHVEMDRLGAAALNATEARTHISHFRSDIEGLRAIAIGMVIAYHLASGLMPGGFAGVDVFFVISGFLITSQLAKEVGRDGRISLVKFYARRAKRLFPAAALVLLATLGLTVLLLPSTRWSEVGGDVFAAAAYFVNWHLAARSVDYLAEGSAPSPVQHFWSLSVEEQYYLAWPVLLCLALALLKRWFRPRTILWLSLAALALPSLVYSIRLTPADPGPAYFVTPTRMWELAIGGAVALAANACRAIPRTAACILGWCGLACIMATLALVDTNTPWPGYMAALPTLGSAAVIVAGFSAGRNGPVRVLGTQAFCWVGAISYSLYLWHWPLIEAANAYFGTSSLTLVPALGVLACAVLLSWLTLNFLENPIRFSSRMTENPRYAISIGLNFSLAGAVAGLLLVVTILYQPAQQGAAQGASALGARALGANPKGDPAGLPVDHIDWYTPTATTATLDNPEVYSDGCQISFAQATPKPCVYGARDGRITVAVVGDSKMVQWMPALQDLARKHDWKLVLNGKASCGFTSRMLRLHGKPYASCYEWNRAVFKLLSGPDKPDYLITSLGSGGTKVRQAEVGALLDWWRPLSKAGVKIIAIANNPGPPGDMYTCVAEHADKLSDCAFPRTPGSGTPSMKAAVAQLPGARFIDLNDAICPDARCPAIIGNVLIYRQGSHITRTYMRTLTPRLEQALAKAGLH